MLDSGCLNRDSQDVMWPQWRVKFLDRNIFKFYCWIRKEKSSKKIISKPISHKSCNFSQNSPIYYRLKFVKIMIVECRFGPQRGDFHKEDIENPRQIPIN